MKEKYPDKELSRTDPNRDHYKKLSVKEYKEYKEFQKEYLEKKEKAIERLDNVKEVNSRIDEKVKELNSYIDYFSKVDDYINKNGLTLFQYSKDLFYADRGLKEYPSPEKFNPERTFKEEEKSINRELERER